MINNERDNDFNRLMLRSAFQSLFWSVILDRKKTENLNLSKLAEKMGVNKSYISRSFNSPPNWQIDKIADMADALGIELELVARDLRSNTIFTPSGVIEYAQAFSSDDVLGCQNTLNPCVSTAETDDGSSTPLNTFVLAS